VAVPAVVANAAETAPSAPPTRSTSRVTMCSSSSIEAAAAVKRRVPGWLAPWSSSVMVSGAADGLVSVAPPVGAESVRFTVSLPSAAPSCRMATENVLSALS
jgi:hypothetical protein